MPFLRANSQQMLGRKLGKFLVAFASGKCHPAEGGLVTVPGQGLFKLLAAAEETGNLGYVPKMTSQSGSQPS